MSYLEVLKNYFGDNENSSIACPKTEPMVASSHKQIKTCWSNATPSQGEGKYFVGKEKEKEDNIGWYLGVLGQYKAIVVDIWL